MSRFPVLPPEREVTREDIIERQAQIAYEAVKRMLPGATISIHRNDVDLEIGEGMFKMHVESPGVPR